MSLIITRMPRKRQKGSFVDRLLELGIVKDKKECRKKRQKKSNAKSTETDDDKSNGKLLNNRFALCRNDRVELCHFNFFYIVNNAFLKTIYFMFLLILFHIGISNIPLLQMTPPSRVPQVKTVTVIQGLLPLQSKLNQKRKPLRNPNKMLTQGR